MNDIKINKKHHNPYLESLKSVRSSERRIPQRIYKPEKIKPRRSGNKMFLILFILSFLFVVSSSFILWANSKVTLNINAKSSFINIPSDSDFVAYKNPEDGELAFYTINKEVEKSASITADKKEFVKKRAEGKLIVYNTYSKKPLRIIKNTRFQLPDGRVYRSKSSFSIPGYSGDGENKTPGKIVVDVYADEPGSRYNVDKGKFKLPGLKDTDLYDKVWAEVASPISGGYEGEQPIVSDASLNGKIEELKLEAKKELESQIKNINDKLIFKDSLNIVYDVLTQPKSDTIDIKVKAKAYIFSLDDTEFIEYVAKINELDIEEGKKIIINKNEIALNLNTNVKAGTNDTDKISFTAKGVLKIRWVIDDDKIKGELAGKKISETNMILSNFHGIKDYKIDASFLVSKYPEKKDKIILNIAFE